MVCSLTQIYSFIIMLYKKLHYLFTNYILLMTVGVGVVIIEDGSNYYYYLLCC